MDVITKDVIIIDGDLDEISTAIRIARSGYSVSSYEQNNHIDWSDEALTQQIKEIVYRKLATNI